MKIVLELTPRIQRLVLVGIAASILGATAVASAQTMTQAGTTTDTLVGSALYTLGNAVTALRADVTVLQMSERVARATITGSGAVAGSAWIHRVDHPSDGKYIVTFAPGIFAAPPTCVTTANSRDAVPPTLVCYDVTTSSMVCQATAPGKPAPVPVDTGLSLVCAGS
jgi:hypothetical protein